MAKNLPALQESWVQSLGWEDPLEEEMATHSSILAWRILWTAGRLQFLGLHRVGHDWSNLVPTYCNQFSQFISSVMSNSLRPNGLQQPGFPVLELAQSHVHWVSDAIQPSHPLLSSSPFAFHLSFSIKVFSNALLLFSHQVMSNSSQPQGLQHASIHCPSVSPGICSDSCALSQWCHPTFSSSVIPLSSCPQCFPASGSFPMSWLFSVILLKVILPMT